jgi:hypothetical protein
MGVSVQARTGERSLYGDRPMCISILPRQSKKMYKSPYVRSRKVKMTAIT